MSRRKARRAIARGNQNFVVYGLAGVLLLIVAAIVFNLLSQPGQSRLQWDQPPPMTIDPNLLYFATLETELGNVTLVLDPQAAPQTVNSFIFLAEQGFYDGVTFHRVIPGFMAQGGDPTGTGTSGPGYTFPDETDAGLSFDSEGVVAMANSGPDTNGSQFFITFGPQPHLDGQHTIFGRVVSGMEVVRSFTPRDPDADPNAPPGTAIRKITITTQQPG